MGLIRYGPLAQEVAGTVGGVTFARVHSAKIVRGWRGPARKNTPSQMAMRQIQTISTHRWINVLTPTERNQWAAYALTCPFTNSLGATYYLGGFNLFVRNQSVHFQWTGDNLTTPPYLDGFPALPGLVLLFSHANGQLTIESWDPPPDVEDKMLFHVFNYTRRTRNQLGTTLHQTVTVLGVATPPALLYQFPTPLPLSAGNIQAGITWYLNDSIDRVSHLQTALVPSS